MIVGWLPSAAIAGFARYPYLRYCLNEQCFMGDARTSERYATLEDEDILPSLELESATFWLRRWGSNQIVQTV